MEQIDESNRKPRRTFGTPSYKYRNRFAAAVILAGTAIFGLWCTTPIYQQANEKIKREFFTVTEEDKDRKLTFNLSAAPRTKRAIEEVLEDAKERISQR